MYSVLLDGKDFLCESLQSTSHSCAVLGVKHPLSADLAMSSTPKLSSTFSWHCSTNIFTIQKMSAASKNDSFFFNSLFSRRALPICRMNAPAVGLPYIFQQAKASISHFFLTGIVKIPTNHRDPSKLKPPSFKKSIFVRANRISHH